MKRFKIPFSPSAPKVVCCGGVGGVFPVLDAQNIEGFFAFCFCSQSVREGAEKL